MNFKARSTNITKVLYIILVLCIISVMFLSIYSMFNQKNMRDMNENPNSLANNTAENALNNSGDGESDDSLMGFFKKTTTEIPTEPPTQRATQRPTSPPTEPPIIVEPVEPAEIPSITEPNSQTVTTDIKFDPRNERNSFIETTEDSIQVMNEQSSFNMPVLFFKPTAGYISRAHNPDKPEYSVAMNDYRTHMGIDIDSGVGVNVKAVSDGVISEIYDDPLMGKTVVIDHPDNIRSIYMNLQELLPKNITVGAKVKGGDVIGGVGETALIEISDVPHLHLEMKKAGNYVDPLEYIIY